MLYFRESLEILETEKSLQLYHQLVSIVLFCHVGAFSREQVVDAYFLNVISFDTFDSDDLTELELVDSKVNLLIGDEYDVFFANRLIGIQYERE